MVRLGEAVSMNNPENEKIKPDDRQQMLEVLGGVVVQDYGHIETGDKISWTLQFDKKNWEIVKGYWQNRTVVNVQDSGGDIFQVRVVVQSYSHVKGFESEAYTVTMELWRV